MRIRETVFARRVGDTRLRRRQFLGLVSKGIGLAAGSAFARDLLPPPGEPLAAGRSRLKVESAVVIGGGIAGLSAAYALLRKGKTVTLLEQQDRVGGLLSTRRWPNGQISEDGAEEINDTDEYLWPLVEQLGVETVELLGTDAVYFRSVYSEADSFEAIVERLPLATKAKQDLWEAISKIESIQAGFGHPFLDPAYHIYDKVSFQTWLAAQGWHPEVNRLLDMGVRAEACASTAQMNAFEGIDLYTLVRKARWFQFKGGNDTFPRALAQALGSAVHLGCEVVSVKQSERDVEVTYRHQDLLHTLRADGAIFAVPSPAVAQIAEDLPRGKKQALLAVPYHTYLNPALRFRERFWHTLYGMKTWALNTDTILNYVIDQTYTQPGQEGILVLHIVADDGAAYSSLSDEQVLDLCLDQLASLWPRAREFYLEGHVSRLGTLRYPFQRPGFLRHLATLLAEPVGRFFFCGDYTNGEGDLNGACFSGLRMADDYLA